MLLQIIILACKDYNHCILADCNLLNTETLIFNTNLFQTFKRFNDGFRFGSFSVVGI